MTLTTTADSLSVSNSQGRSESRCGDGFRVALVICKRELVRFVRQPTRIGSAIGTPVILWLFMASGFSGSMSGGMSGAMAGGSGNVGGGVPYSLYLLPGMMMLVAMFTAIFSSISIIEDRNEGWLQSVLVSPTPRWSIAAGKILGGSTIAFLQAILLLAAVPILGGRVGFEGIVEVVFALFVSCVAMTGVGVAFAWVSESTQGFHAVMNLVLMPLWMLSGAFFSTESASGWLRVLMYLNPLTWATSAIRTPLDSVASGGEGGVGLNVGSATLSDFLNHPPWWFAMAVACAFAVFMFAAATWIVARPRKWA